MLQDGDRVVAGISGGADSVCLLFLLLEWSRDRKLDIAVVHINHMIRREAEQDAAFVAALCKTYGLPFYLKEIDVQGKAKQEHLSEEEAGRNARYEAFSQVAEEWGANKIAVAHNSNDRSETMLFHLFRGSGIKGLAGIEPVRGRIIRPLLCLERWEIEHCVQVWGTGFCRDATNLEDDYTRNRIRHHVLPFAQEQISKGCVAHMAQTADLLSEIEDYLAVQTKEAMKQCVLESKKGRMELATERLLELHPAIRKRVLLEAVQQAAASRKDIGYVHIRSVLELCEREGNRSVHLPFRVQVRREYGKLILEYSSGTKLQGQESLCQEIDRTQLEESGVALALGEDRYLEMMIFSQEKTEEVPKNQYTKWLDYDKIKESLFVRTRQVGDYLSICSQEQLQHKKLKDYMIAEKIPKEVRDRIPVLADGQHVMWLVGYRISEYYKIRENTKRILQVQLVEKSTEQRMEDKNG